MAPSDNNVERTRLLAVTVTAVALGSEFEPLKYHQPKD